MSSTLLLGLGQSGVTGRLWSQTDKGEPAPESFDASVGYPGVWDVRGTTPDEPSLGFQNVPRGTTRVWLRAPGYLDQAFDCVMPDDGAKEIRLERAPVTLKRLRVDGRHFRTDDGRVDLVLADCYQGMDRFQSGEDLRPIFAQLQAKGFNGIRVFGMNRYIAEQLGRPIYIADPAQIAAFCRLAMEYGLYVLWVVFADGLIPEAQQVAYFLAVVDALKQVPNTIGSLVNEYTEHENYVDRGKFPQPSGIAFSSGSAGTNVANNTTTPPWWDFDEFHPRRDRPSSIKDCCVVDHPNYLQGLAVLIDELDRFGSQGTNDPEYCALQAGAGQESALGVCFHSKNGVYAQVFDVETEAHADAFVRATQ